MLTSDPPDTAAVTAAEAVVPCADLHDTLVFFTDRLGFRVELITPADDPRVAVVSGYGLRLRLDTGAEGAPGELRLRGGGRTFELTAPNGTLVRIVPEEEPMVVPPLAPAYVLARGDETSSWGVGRAGMRYRDLIPDRLGGRFIASHIHIPAGGPVPDYVHFHRVRFQMIYCYRGWVRVVYEDQGQPFVLGAGDCVLQPPTIRHRVLESSPDLEVIEIGCPAEHETRGDLEMRLPTPEVRPDRRYGDGQRFAHHEAARATWQPWSVEGFEYRDTGIGGATDGLAGVRVVRPAGPVLPRWRVPDAELWFLFVLEGGLVVRREGHDPDRLGPGDSVVIPAGTRVAIEAGDTSTEVLEVSLPDRLGLSA